MPSLNRKYLVPSGLNDRFYGLDMTFENYIELMKNIIIESRIDLNNDNADQIVLANSPFTWQNPHTAVPTHSGVLLIHGLFDSPYYVKDLGEFFLTKNFLVNAVLLPGHGTVPGDLLTVKYKEWAKAVKYGVTTLGRQVENIYLLGYSLGGMLALYEALESKENIKGIILIAPAMRARNPLKNFLAKNYHLFGWLGDWAKWYQLRAPNNYTKYSCHAFNAGYQARMLIDDFECRFKHQKLTPPIFIAISENDETISHQAILSFFLLYLAPRTSYSCTPTRLELLMILAS